VQLGSGERHDIGQDLAIAVVDERGTIGSSVTGPPADPFGQSTSDYQSDPFAGSPPPVSARQPGAADPFGTAVPDHEQAADRGAYVDPNNPFA